MRLADELKGRLEQNLNFFLQKSRIKIFTSKNSTESCPKELIFEEEQGINKNTEELLNDSLSLAKKLLISVHEYIKISFQSSLRFIGDDLESDLNEHITFYQKRVAKLNKKVIQLASVVRSVLSKPKNSKPLSRDFGTFCDIPRHESLSLQILPSLRIEGRPLLAQTEVSDDRHSSETLQKSPDSSRDGSPRQLAEADSSLFQLGRSVRSLGVEPGQLETANQAMRQVLGAADQVHGLMLKFAQLAEPSRPLPGHDVQTQGRLNLIAFQSDKLCRQLTELLELLAALAGASPY